MTCRSNGHSVTVDYDRQWEKMYTFPGPNSGHNFASRNFYSNHNLNHHNFHVSFLNFTTESAAQNNLLHSLTSPPTSTPSSSLPPTSPHRTP